MANIKKIKEGTATIYPATIPQAVVDPTSGKTVRAELDEDVVKKISTDKYQQSDIPFAVSVTSAWAFVKETPIEFPGKIEKLQFAQPIPISFSSNLIICDKPLTSNMRVLSIHDITINSQILDLTAQNIIVEKGQYVGLVNRTSGSGDTIYKANIQGDVYSYAFNSVEMVVGTLSTQKVANPLEFDYSIHVSYNIKETIEEKLPKTAVKNVLGSSEVDVINQKVATENINELKKLWLPENRTNSLAGSIPLLLNDTVSSVISTGYAKSDITNPIEGLNEITVSSYVRTGELIYPVSFINYEQNGEYGFWFKKSNYTRLRVQLSKIVPSPATYIYVDFIPTEISVGGLKETSNLEFSINVEITEQSGDYYFAKVAYTSVFDSTIEKMLIPYDAIGYPGAITGNAIGQEYHMLCYVDPSNPFNSSGKISVSKIIDLSQRDTNVRLYLPDHITAELGKPLYLFKHALTNAFNYKNYNIQVVLDADHPAGDDFNRYWLYTPTLTGARIATIRLYNNERVLLDEKTVTINVINRTTQPISPVTVLFIGDSLTYYNRLSDEFLRVLTSSDAQSIVQDTCSLYTVIKLAGRSWGNIQLIGTQKLNYLGWIGQTYHEGRSGWSWATFLEASSPFYSGGVLDFNNYLTVNSFTQPDIVYIGLGWNDIATILGQSYNLDTVIGNARAFLTAMTTQWPTTKIKLWTQNVPGTRGGFGAHPFGSTEWADEQRAKILMLTLSEAYKTLAAEFTNVDVVWATAQIDSEYSLQELNANVNGRINLTEVRGKDYVHPSDAGFFQISDALIADFVGYVVERES